MDLDTCNHESALLAMQVAGRATSAFEFSVESLLQRQALQAETSSCGGLDLSTSSIRPSKMICRLCSLLRNPTGSEDHQVEDMSVLPELVLNK